MTKPSLSNLRNISENTRTQRAFAALGLRAGKPDAHLDNLPFSAQDITVGTEAELQAAVLGSKDKVDLPLAIETSAYYANLQRRIARGDAPRRALNKLESYLNENLANVWENSWVHFPLTQLNPAARAVWESDLQANKQDRQRGLRTDHARFLIEQQGELLLRVPISYLLKLALADHLGQQPAAPAWLRQTSTRLLAHFLNDNSSPETFSFHVIPFQPAQGNGLAVAREAAKRFLLSNLLALYANRHFGLQAQGQRTLVYFAPHPPQRQQQLNGCISDAFYRELFMSPCLSGWDDGEAKHAYMHLCHQVLSRSQLNAIAKLREAGIIANNLVVLPNLSNVSLANNGIHVSLGSHRLTAARRAGLPDFGAAEEKWLGDLAIKIVEHFLPLFVGHYSAAPYRLAFSDFHPEKVLGFLPHELDYTHLRMLWRRWRGKADLRIFGYPMTPCGPEWLDHSLSQAFRLRGDFVADFRLLDYPVALLSTESSPALDGTVGSAARLKRELTALGSFDERMPLYLLYRLREFNEMGFSGFEGRHYSLFPSLREDMRGAVELQTLITALAFKYQALGRYDHADIPDQPFIESERRQIFFGAAIGLPTFFVQRETPNRLLRDILKRTKSTRVSHRYPGYLRVKQHDYQHALLQLLKDEAADLVEALELGEMLNDLQQRLEVPAEHGAAQRLTRGILGGSGTPLHLPASEFNEQAETYYRTELRAQHLAEAFDFLKADLRQLELIEMRFDETLRPALRYCLPRGNAAEFIEDLQDEVLTERVSEAQLLKLINLLLLTLHHDQRVAAQLTGTDAERIPDENEQAYAATPIC